MEHIILAADKVWDYYCVHKEELKTSQHKIAENADFGVEIYLTEDGKWAEIDVYCDDSPVYSESMLSYRDCCDTVKRIYGKYLSSNIVSALPAAAPAKKSEVKEEPSRVDLEDAIQEREDELSDAVIAFLRDTVGESLEWCSLEFDEMCDDLKEHFLEYIARKYGVDVYRPMFLVDEKGEEFFVEYPYDNMIFDDPDNPIYKREE